MISATVERLRILLRMRTLGAAATVSAATVAAAIASTAIGLAEPAFATAYDEALVITHSVDAGLASNATARRGRGHVVAGQLQLDVAARAISDLSALPLLAVSDYGQGVPASALLKRATALMLGQADTLARQLESWLRTQGASTATYSFRQAVQVAGVTTTQFLSWHMLIQTGGRARYGDPTLIDPVNGPLEVSYTPLRVALGLPPSWALPNAGMLRWRRLDPRLVPVSDWTTFDSAGAWDEPTPVPGATIDSDVAVRCLANRTLHSGCNASGPDVQDLLDQTGATHALLDYLRTLKPVYDTVAQSDGSNSQVARAAIAVDLREWQMSGCSGGSYRNAGSYGMELAARTERYRVALGASAELLQARTDVRISPMAPFDRSKTDVRGLSASEIGNWVVDLDNPDGPLLALASMPSIVSAGPVSIIGASQESFLHADLYHGWCGRAISLRASCRADGNIDLVIGGGSGVANCAQDESMFDTRSWVLQRGIPLSAQLYPGGDRVPPVAWSYDGTSRVIFSRSPQSLMAGDGYLPGLQGFTYLAFFSGFGVNTRRNFPSGGPVSFWFESFQCPPDATPAGQFSSIDPAPGDIGTSCLAAAHPEGPINACQRSGETEVCGTYRTVEPAWVPSQQWPWRPCDSTCTIGAGG